MNEDVIYLEELLKNRYDGLSPSEQRVVDYILDNYEEAAS